MFAIAHEYGHTIFWHMSHSTKKTDYMTVSEISRRAGVSVRTVQRDATRLMKHDRSKWQFEGAKPRAKNKYHHQYPRKAALEYIKKRRSYRKGQLPRKTHQSDWSEPLPAFPHKPLLAWCAVIRTYSDVLAITALTATQTKRIRKTLATWSRILCGVLEDFDRVRGAFTPGATQAEIERFERTSELAQMRFSQFQQGLPKQKPLKPWKHY